MGIPAPKVPTFTLTLPVSKQKISYRPFLVKEEKILLMANEEADGSTEIKDAIIQVCDSCTFNKLKVDKLPVADLEFLFINIRTKSISETMDFVVTCPSCNTEIDYKVELPKVKVQNEVKDVNINIGDNTIVTMSYPSILTSEGVEKVKSVDIETFVIAKLIKSITIDDQVYDVADFTEVELIAWCDLLSHSQLSQLKQFLDKLPKIVYEDIITCTCGEKLPIYMEGLESFFDH